VRAKAGFLSADAAVAEVGPGTPRPLWPLLRRSALPARAVPARREKAVAQARHPILALIQINAAAPAGTIAARCRLRHRAT
jgi:hypothetical protein